MSTQTKQTEKKIIGSRWIRLISSWDFIILRFISFWIYLFVCRVLETKASRQQQQYALPLGSVLYCRLFTKVDGTFKRWLWGKQKCWITRNSIIVTISHHSTLSTAVWLNRVKQNNKTMPPHHGKTPGEPAARHACASNRFLHHTLVAQHTTTMTRVVISFNIWWATIYSHLRKLIHQRDRNYVAKQSKTVQIWFCVLCAVLICNKVEENLLDI